MKEAILALLGYAIGTGQVIISEWIKSRLAHVRHLRLLSVDLRRLASFHKKFNWGSTGPMTVTIPNPPRTTPRFLDLLTQTDFRITDEFRNDTAEEALLSVIDGCELLAKYHALVERMIDTIETDTDPAKLAERREELLATTQAYDAAHEVVMTTVSTALDDFERRLRESRWSRQVRRALRRRLPIGVVPPPLEPEYEDASPQLPS